MLFKAIAFAIGCLVIYICFVVFAPTLANRALKNVPMIAFDGDFSRKYDFSKSQYEPNAFINFTAFSSVFKAFVKSK